MKFRRWQALALAALVVGLCVPSSVVAQTGTGTIDGRILDESRAAFPASEVRRERLDPLIRSVG